MKKLKYIIVLLTLAAIALCACSQTPLQCALSTAKSEFGIDLKSESVTVERLAYTYDDGNIFGEGFAAYKISFSQDASAHFAGLDTTPDADADDGIELARENGVELPAVPDSTPFAYKSENQGLNRVFLLYYSAENIAYLITLDA